MAKAKDTIRQIASFQGIMMVLVAAVLLAATSIIQSYYARRGLLMQAEQQASRELTISQLRIEDITDPVEAVVDNTAWMVEMNLSNPDSLHFMLRKILDNNPILADAAIGFAANYYPDKGYWYEPVVARRDNGEYEEMVLGSPSHDYFNLDWYSGTAKTGERKWSEPYYDESAGRTTVITYSSPVRDTEGNIVAVISADLTLEWLAELLQDVQPYPNTYSTLVSQNGQLLVTSSADRTPQDVIEYTRLIESTGWIMSIVIPRNEIFRTVNRLSEFLGLLQLLGLGLLAFIAVRSVKDQSKLEKVRSKKDKLDNELRIAREIQMAMLPKTFPPFPERNDVDLTATIVPAKEVGGDIYDFFIRNDKLFFCIGDVSGKGVPAALVMAVTRSLFRTVSAHEKSPMRIVSSMNESMSEMNDSNMFVTFFCGVLNLNSGHLRYCNAGHNAPLVLADKVERLSVVPNLPLGVMPEMQYEEQDCYLAEGNSLFMYTDGITEAENASREQFGESRAMETLGVGLDVTENQERILSSVKAFVGEAERSDDLTMLIVRYLGADKSKESRRSLVLRNDIQQIPHLAEFILSIADEKHLGNSVATNLNLALEEAVTNVMLYAYPKDTEGIIEIEALIKDNSLIFKVMDSGKPFDPTSVPEVDVTKDLADRPIGGLGIHLVRKIMDEVRYSREDGRNIFTMIKNI
ncbi:MAG: SpoIIE family protein phosphatase [Bacteroidales bacterium]|nr:SpoIIE family protein phosphatase [Bacteroidales bacterium]